VRSLQNLSHLQDVFEAYEFAIYYLQLFLDFVLLCSYDVVGIAEEAAELFAGCSL
jgi:hypothetical protein